MGVNRKPPEPQATIAEPQRFEVQSKGADDSTVSSKPVSKTLDYVTLLATFALGASACVAIVYGQDTVAGASVAGIAGFITRLYK